MKHKTQPQKKYWHKQMIFNCLVLFLVTTFIVSCKKDGNYGDIKSPVVISPEIPVDVSLELQKELKEKNDNFYSLNQAFNKQGWQSFVAVFWPRDKEGIAMPNFTDEGKATWLGWKEAFQVYRNDGGIPTPWGSKRRGGGLGLDKSIVGDEDARVFLSPNMPAHKGRRSKNIADEDLQAFAGKLFDQNGNTVVYEVLMNKEEYDYLLTNKLYNINGQIDFTKNGRIADFPKGDYATKKVGAIEIKFAWKVLKDTDHKERYYKSRGYVVDSATNKLVKKDLGMIGFHISQKTPTGSQWVWSTFEHIDNLDQNVIEKDGKQTPIHPSLTDPNCETCPVNIDASNNSSYKFTQGAHGDFWKVSGDANKYYANGRVMKTQAKRMIDIPVRVQQLNREMQAFFKSQKSVFQYYQLIDTQYPTNQNVPPGNHTEAGYKIPGSIVNKPGGNPNLAMLTNITMETFFQGGDQLATNFMEANPKSDITVFGTESCMGCHSSAGIITGITKTKITRKNPIATDSIITAPQLSGDFSWLLSQKAKLDKRLPRP